MQLMQHYFNRTVIKADLTAVLGLTKQSLDDKVKQANRTGKCEDGE